MVEKIEKIASKGHLSLTGSDTEDGVSSETKMFELKIDGADANIYLDNGGSNTVTYKGYVSNDGSNYFEDFSQDISSGGSPVIKNITGSPTYIKVTCDASTSTDSIHAYYDVNKA